MITAFTNRKKLFTFILFVFFICVVDAIIYILLNVDNLSGSAVALSNRGIETPLKLWLNGYFALFFNFGYLGNLGWIIIPLIFIFYLFGQYRQRWHYAALLIYIVSYLIIARFGFYNNRYALTLLPFTVVAVVYFMIEMFEKWEMKKYLLFILIFLGITIIFNNAVIVKKLFSKGTLVQASVGKTNSIPDKIIRPDKHAEVKNENMLHKLLYGTENLEIADYINAMPEKSGFLVNNAPLFYYYCPGKNGLYYWCGDDVLYTKSGKRKLLNRPTDKDICTYLSDTLKCNYILTCNYYIGYNEHFDSFLKGCFNLEYSDSKNGYLLYKLKE